MRAMCQQFIWRRRVAPVCLKLLRIKHRHFFDRNDGHNTFLIWIMATKNRFSPKASSVMPWLGLSAIVILLDQLSKITMVKLFVLGESYKITSFFNLLLAHNSGSAFSFLQSASGWQRYFFTAIGIAASLFIIYQLKRHAGQRLFSCSLAFILGGAIGNVIDRIMYGYVIDFLDFYIPGANIPHWPTFNLADSAIFLGAALFILDELRRVNK